MKFGKEILGASLASLALCDAKEWMDYKMLKTQIKLKLAKGEKEDKEGIGSTDDKETRDKEEEKKGKEALTQSDSEREFFLLLRSELSKVATTFKELERKCFAALNRLSREINTLVLEVVRSEKVQSATTKQRVEELTRRCVDIHLHLLMLENYAVLNFAGFVKILKKHDKNTGFATKEPYILKVVRMQDFVEHPWLQSAIKGVENDFRSLQALASARAECDQVFTTSSRSSTSEVPPPRASSTLSAASSPCVPQEQPQQAPTGNAQSAAEFSASKELTELVKLSVTPELHRRLHEEHSLYGMAVASKLTNWVDMVIARSRQASPSGSPKDADPTSSETKGKSDSASSSSDGEDGSPQSKKDGEETQAAALQALMNAAAAQEPEPTKRKLDGSDKESMQGLSFGSAMEWMANNVVGGQEEKKARSGP